MVGLPQSQGRRLAVAGRDVDRGDDLDLPPSLRRRDHDAPAGGAGSRGRQRARARHGQRGDGARMLAGADGARAPAGATGEPDPRTAHRQHRRRGVRAQQPPVRRLAGGVDISRPGSSPCSVPAADAGPSRVCASRAADARWPSGRLGARRGAQRSLDRDLRGRPTRRDRGRVPLARGRASRRAQLPGVSSRRAGRGGARPLSGVGLRRSRPAATRRAGTRHACCCGGSPGSSPPLS